MSTSLAPKITCLQCNNQNEGSRRFCATCGDSLWSNCPSCNAECPVCETFCGQCGENLGALAQQRLDEINERLQSSQQLAEQHRYDDAVQRLQLVAKLEEKRFETYVKQAKERIQQFTTTRDRLLKQAHASLVDAQHLAENYCYEEATSLLERTPTALRSDDFQRLLKSCRSKRDNLARLNHEMRLGVKENRLDRVAANIDEILVLQPNHTKALQLAKRVRSRFCDVATKLIKSHAYDKALTVLQRTPTCERDDRVETLIKEAGERNWLLNQLQTAAYANKTTLGIANRLLKIAPTNDDAKKFRDAIVTRAKQLPHDGRWAAPNCSVGGLFGGTPEVEAWTGFESVDVDESTRAIFQEHPGQFFVSVGLALQGVERAAVTTNLMEKQAAGLLGKFSFGRSKPASSAWGIDIGSRGLKVVKITADPAAPTTKPRIEEAAFIAHETPLNHPGAHGRREEITSATVVRFLEQHDVAGVKICVGLPGTMVLARFIDLPPLDLKQVDDVMKHEVTHQVPFPLEDIVWDYHLNGAPASEQERDGRSAMMVAVKSHSLTPFVENLQDAGLKLDALQCECVAIHNFTMHEFGSDTSNSDEAMIVIEVGTNATNLVVSSSHSIWFRSMGIGGDAVTRGVANSFKLTSQQAEALKANPTQARYISQLYEVVDPLIEKFVAELQRSLDAYKNSRGGSTINQVLGIGGGFQLHGLLRRLRSK